MAAPCSEASPRSRILPCIAPPPGSLGRARRPRSRASNKAENYRRSVFAVLSCEGGFSLVQNTRQAINERAAPRSAPVAARVRARTLLRRARQHIAQGLAGPGGADEIVMH